MRDRRRVVERDRHVRHAPPAVAPDVVALDRRDGLAARALEAADDVDEAPDARGGDLGPLELRRRERRPAVLPRAPVAGEQKDGGQAEHGGEHRGEKHARSAALRQPAHDPAEACASVCSA